jgi:hypothetical protein
MIQIIRSPYTNDRQDTWYCSAETTNFLVRQTSPGSKTQQAAGRHRQPSKIRYISPGETKQWPGASATHLLVGVNAVDEAAKRTARRAATLLMVCEWSGCKPKRRLRLLVRADTMAPIHGRASFNHSRNQPNARLTRPKLWIHYLRVNKAQTNRNKILTLYLAFSASSNSRPFSNISHKSKVRRHRFCRQVRLLAVAAELE